MTKEAASKNLATLSEIKLQDHHVPLLALRLATLVVLVVLLTTHMRSFRVFRWEQSVSGGVLVTYCVAAVGLAMCAGAGKCGVAFQAYLAITGFLLLTVNAVVLWARWQNAEDMRVVAEFLVALGVPLRRRMMTKVWLSAAAAVLFFVDGLLVLMLSSIPEKFQTK